MAYINTFRYLGLYETSYKSYIPNFNQLSAFNNIISAYSKTTNPTEEDVVNHIDDLLKFLNYSDFIKHAAQTQQRQSSHADIEIVVQTTQVIIEVKKPSNTNEMPSPQSILSKALYECIWYYFNRKDLVETYSIKHLVITDGFNYYFIKPASIAKLKLIENLCVKYKNKKLSLPGTSSLYQSIARIIKDNNYENQIIWTHISIQGNLEYLYKLLHRNFLLREYVASDNNILNNSFYNGLLEIIGLEQDKNCLLVQSKSKNSLVYGIMESGIGFDDALRLASTWINRLLFLKLFEQQLISFNRDNTYSFLNYLKTFSDYQILFFNVLGTEYNLRNSYVSSYSKVPFLNSSLFEQIDLEYKCNILFLDSLNLNVGNIPLSQYIIKFLNKYNFVSNISTQNTDINPSILGLIFEKIDGYSDGAVFTPAYITEYMTKETIDKLVINRVNQYFVPQGKEPCNDIEEVKFLLDACIHQKNVKSFVNNLFDTLRICDPAVGSGHFLVSALNYLLYLKFYLGLISIPNISLDIQNDCLIVYEFKDNDYKQFKYDRKNQDSLNTQKVLFTEKSKIIRKNLFGVDINPTSVNICKLRLWIELLKNCYYLNQTDMEILPNLDINVLCGNSLISSFKYQIGRSPSINSVNIFGGLSNSVYVSEPNQLNKDLSDYRILVDKFWNARTKDYKKDIRKQIDKIKSRLNPYDLFNENYEQNQIFNNGINWGIDFPEVIESKTGVFLGFDAVITNPPYGVSLDKKFSIISSIFGKCPDKEIYYYFIKLALKLINKDGFISLIIPNTWLFNFYAKEFRKDLLENYNIVKLLDCSEFNIFDEVQVRNSIFIINNQKTSTVSYKFCRTKDDISSIKFLSCTKDELLKWNQNWTLFFKLPQNIKTLINKILASRCATLIEKFPIVSQGLIAYDKYQGTPPDVIKNRSYHHSNSNNGEYKPFLSGESILRYKLNYCNNLFIDYDINKIANPRKPDYFKGRRLLIREITNPRIYATFTCDEYYNDPAIIIVKDHDADIDLYTLLALINSKLYTFFHFNFSPKSSKGLFPKLLVNDIKNLPIPKIDSNIDNTLKGLVSNQMESYSNDVDSQIDKIIYKLFNLNEEDISIIEDFISAK